MKKFYLLALAITISFVSCENEEISVEEETSLETDVIAVEADLEIEDFEEIQNDFFAEVNDLNLQEFEGINLESIDFINLSQDEKTISKGRYRHRPRLTSLCLVKDADRCPNEGRQPVSNMWWPENETDFFNPTTYFSSTRRHRMLFATFSNGTALIRGINSMNEGKCKVFVNIWLKDKQTFDEFNANGGEFKREIGCASQAADENEIVYYEIDSSRSVLCSWGSDCIEQGSYGLEQRGSESGFGAQLGPNGAAFDSNIGALGLSTWGYITNRETGERLWPMDFDFRLRCCGKLH